jgi:hypothetical protein
MYHFSENKHKYSQILKGLCHEKLVLFVVCRTCVGIPHHKRRSSTYVQILKIFSSGHITMYLLCFVNQKVLLRVISIPYSG